jgi:hypothetical protein
MNVSLRCLFISRVRPSAHDANGSWNLWRNKMYIVHISRTSVLFWMGSRAQLRNESSLICWDPFISLPENFRLNWKPGRMCNLLRTSQRRRFGLDLSTQHSRSMARIKMVDSPLVRFATRQRTHCLAHSGQSDSLRRDFPSCCASSLSWEIAATGNWARIRSLRGFVDSEIGLWSVPSHH